MNKQEILQYVDKKFHKKDHIPFHVGDTVKVHVRITEGDTARVQAFEGIVIAFKGQGGSSTFMVRKVSFGVGVERLFPLHSPAIDKIDVVRSGHVRRAKLYYLRDRVGRAARLEEKEAGAVELKKAAETKSASTPPSPQQELVAIPQK